MSDDAVKLARDWLRTHDIRDDYAGADLARTVIEQAKTIREQAAYRALDRDLIAALRAALAEACAIADEALIEFEKAHGFRLGRTNAPHFMRIAELRRLVT